MRRVAAAAAVLFSLLFSVLAAATPASADDEAAVRARLAAVADQAAQNRQQVEQLETEIQARQRRVAEERQQLVALARAIYVQPEDTLVVIAQAPNLAEALTRVTDLLAAAGRARATKQKLDSDLARLASEKAQLESRQSDLEVQQKELENEYARLAALAAVAAPERPAPPPAPSGSIPDLIRQAWAPLGPATQDWAVRLAFCESTLNPLAVNPSSGAAGLFQFMPTTWAGTPWHAQSPFDASANAAAAAWLYQRYGPGRWSCSSRI